MDFVEGPGEAIVVSPHENLKNSNAMDIDIILGGIQRGTSQFGFTKALEARDLEKGSLLPPEWEAELEAMEIQEASKLVEKTTVVYKWYMSRTSRAVGKKGGFRVFWLNLDRLVLLYINPETFAKKKKHWEYHQIQMKEKDLGDLVSELPLINLVKVLPSISSDELNKRARTEQVEVGIEAWFNLNGVRKKLLFTIEPIPDAKHSPKYTWKMWLCALYHGHKRARLSIRFKDKDFIGGLWRNADIDKSGSLSFAELIAFIRTLNIAVDVSYLEILWRSQLEDGTGVTQYDGFRKALLALFKMPALTEKYLELYKMQDQQELSPRGLLPQGRSEGAEEETHVSFFVRKETIASFFLSEQNDTPTWCHNALTVMDRFPIPFRCRDGITAWGFRMLMCSGLNSALKPNFVYTTDDQVNKPLEYYFVASSHNTYLTNGQLLGDSSVYQYADVLRSGCRCIEIDIWDGYRGVPVVYHGHTFTSKIPLDSVLRAIQENAFITNPYPVIISIEIHTSPAQTNHAAALIAKRLGGALMWKEEADLISPEFWNPKFLKKRFLIKAHVHVKDAEDSMSLVNEEVRLNLLEQDARKFREEFIEEVAPELVRDYPDKFIRLLGPKLSKGPEYARRGEIEDLALMRFDMPSAVPQDGSVPCTVPTRRGTSSFRRNKDLSRAVLPRGTESPDFQLSQVGSGISLERSAKRFARCHPKGKGKNGNESKRSCDKDFTAAWLQFSRLVVFKTERIGDWGRCESLRRDAGDVDRVIYSANEHLVSKVTRKAVNRIRAKSTSELMNELKLQLAAEREVARYTNKHFVRVYPGGSRIYSSNPNPLEFWRFGIQMVALNYQRDGTALMLNKARFMRGGESGYSLKPEYMWREDKEPMGEMDLQIHILGASQLPRPANEPKRSRITPLTTAKEEPLDCCFPFVKVSVFSTAYKDAMSARTMPEPNNGFNPCWKGQRPWVFPVPDPELAILLVEVWHEDIVRNELLCCNAFPIDCLREGIRWFEMYNPATGAIIPAAGCLARIGAQRPLNLTKMVDTYGRRQSSENTTYVVDYVPEDTGKENNEPGISTLLPTSLVTGDTSWSFG